MIENCKILWNGKLKQTNTKCFIDILLEIMTFQILSHFQGNDKLGYTMIYISLR